MKSIIYAALAGFGLGLLILLLSGIAWAAEIPREKAVDCIIGEAESEGAAGMAALAHALRNRGTTLAVYGCNSRRVKEHLYGAAVFVQAVKAWEESRHGTDPTHGANCWQSEADLKKMPSRITFCDMTVHIGGHYFFKCE